MNLSIQYISKFSKGIIWKISDFIMPIIGHWFSICMIIITTTFSIAVKNPWNLIINFIWILMLIGSFLSSWISLQDQIIITKDTIIISKEKLLKFYDRKDSTIPIDSDLLVEYCDRGIVFRYIGQTYPVNVVERNRANRDELNNVIRILMRRGVTCRVLED